MVFPYNFSFDLSSNNANDVVDFFMCIMSFHPSPKEKCAHISFVCYCFSVDD